MSCIKDIMLAGPLLLITWWPMECYIRLNYQQLIHDDCISVKSIITMTNITWIWLNNQRINTISWWKIVVGGKTKTQTNRTAENDRNLFPVTNETTALIL